jgi:hypothetical protein
MEFYQEIYGQYRAYKMQGSFIRIFDMQGRHIVDASLSEPCRLYLNDVLRGFRTAEYMMAA